MSTQRIEIGRILVSIPARYRSTGLASREPENSGRIHIF